MRMQAIWNGKASYYHLTEEEETNPDAAWQYQRPFLLARRVKHRDTFWHGVRVVPAVDERRARR